MLPSYNRVDTGLEEKKVGILSLLVQLGKCKTQSSLS